MEEKKDKYIFGEEEKETFTDYIVKQVDAAPVVKNFHPKWKELIAWADLGDQFSEWNIETDEMAPVDLKVRKKKVVINLMKPLGEAIEGKINFSYQLVGQPNSGEKNDVFGAQVATKLLAHNDYVNNIDELTEDIKYDLIRTGNAFWKWTWKTSATGKIKKKVDGDPKDTVDIPGELICEAPSVFNIRVDPTAKRLEDARWILEIGEVTIDDIVENFDITEDELKEAAGESGYQATKYRGMYENVLEKDPDEKTEIVIWYWERKSDKHKEGRHIILTKSGVYLHNGPNRELGELPFDHFGYKRVGNSFWHQGPFHYVQPIQREFNRMVSIISEHVEGWRAKMVVPMNSIIKKGAYTTDSFELLEVDTTKGEPHPLRTPELSMQVMAWRDFLVAMVDKVSNVHEPSYSQLPKYASRAPASLYAMMLEQENIKIEPLIKKINSVIKKRGKFRLRMMDKYYKQPRLVAIMGEDRKATVQYFKGADLNGNFDVKLSLGVSLNQSRTVQQKLLLDLFQQGVITDKNKILKALTHGTIEEDVRSDISDESRATRENQAFIDDSYGKTREKGGIFVYMHDDHKLHLEKHTDLAKSEEAEQWPDKKWKDLDAHVMEHYYYFMMLQRLMAQQGQNTGTTGPPAQIPGEMEAGGGGTPGPIPEDEGMTDEAGAAQAI